MERLEITGTKSTDIITEDEQKRIRELDISVLTPNLIKRLEESNVAWVCDSYLSMRGISRDPKLLAFLDKVAEIKYANCIAVSVFAET